MKAIITTYNKTDEGLVLRNNYLQEVPSYDLKEFLMEYFESLEELECALKKAEVQLERYKYSSIIECEQEFVYHIRFIL
ncbi:MAG TPA: hypothetical protein VLA48_02845 [Nitrososphaeraceae archaeon]|nr:hypothetical protein [Nitrososphaeraceae archaeon]